MSQVNIEQVSNSMSLVSVFVNIDSPDVFNITHFPFGVSTYYSRYSCTLVVPFT